MHECKRGFRISQCYPYVGLQEICQEPISRKTRLGSDSLEVSFWIASCWPTIRETHRFGDASGFTSAPTGGGSRSTYPMRISAAKLW